MKKYSIDVNITEDELYDLENGKEFIWRYKSNEDENVQINVRLIQEEDDLGE
tara:strand:+ start:635 stop:790 length:156 start_codon:yes stop_codon:yes gene_type:complete